MMDVGTLGKFTVAGPDASTLIDRMFPCRTDDLVAGRTRYVLSLDEAGYVMDDGLLCALGDGAFYLNSTSGGAGRTDRRLRTWPTGSGSRCILLDRTALARSTWRVRTPATCWRRLTDDGRRAASPTRGTPTSRWRASRAGRSGRVRRGAGVRAAPSAPAQSPSYGTLAARSARGSPSARARSARVAPPGEGAHLPRAGTMPDDRPPSSGCRGRWPRKSRGSSASARSSGSPSCRCASTSGLEFAGPRERRRASRGAARWSGARRRAYHVGRASITLGRPIGLGWIRDRRRRVPDRATTRRATTAPRVVPTPFYDPDGGRLRG